MMIRLNVEIQYIKQIKKKTIKRLLMERFREGTKTNKNKNKQRSKHTTTKNKKEIP